jgi:hypothetical protein
VKSLMIESFCVIFFTIICLKFLGIIVSIIRVGSMFYTFISFHLISKPNHL